MAPKKCADKFHHVINQRVKAVANITRIHDFVKENSDMLSSDALECRLEILENYFSQALSHQAAIEELNFAPENTNSVETRAEIEDLYCKAKFLIKRIIQSHNREITSTPLHERVLSNKYDQLPKLKLPTFSGEYSEFSNFMRLFKQLVHEEHRLSKIEKFNHLLSCLSGPALRTVKALDTIDANYEIALELLEKRFNNKYLMCQDHIRSLFRLKKVQKESPQQLRLLVDTVTSHFSALQSLLTPEEISNAFIVHSVISLLDIDSQSKVEESIDCKKPFNWVDCANILEC